MSRVGLLLDGSDAEPRHPLTRVPVRYPLSLAALEELAGRTGTPLPWQAPAETTAAARVLGEPAPPPPENAGDPLGELTGLGLVDADGEVAPEAHAALAVFGTARIAVELDLGLRRPAAAYGVARFKSWQRYAPLAPLGLVTTVSTAGGHHELSWHTGSAWADELTRQVTPPAERPAGLPAAQEPPAAYLTLPYELLLGSGAAIREGRPAVLAELMGRYPGRVRAEDGTPYAPDAALEQVRRLHTHERGRLQLSVTELTTTGRHGFGLVSWVLFDDGWRALEPYDDDSDEHRGEPMVRLRNVAPHVLAALVATMLTGLPR